MGRNDHLHDERPDLPPEAGENLRRGFVPNEEWLTSAPPELQREAMLSWFYSRYCDPANDTPYIGREGGYMYIHGGPYNADEELPAEFGHVIEEEVIHDAIEEIQSEGIYDWAPIHVESEYELEFELEVSARGEPHAALVSRLEEIKSLAALNLDDPEKNLLRQLLYSHLIGSLEAYLAETMSYWLEAERDVLKRFVQNCKHFQERKLNLSEVFSFMESLEEEVEKHINSLVWHRLDLVMPLFCSSLEIESGDIGEIMKHIVVRHDIVHRGGKTKEGDPVSITSEKLDNLHELITQFANEIEGSLAQRYPPQS